MNAELILAPDPGKFKSTPWANPQGGKGTPVFRTIPSTRQEASALLTRTASGVVLEAGVASRATCQAWPCQIDGSRAV